ncbi:hypothetical protein I7I50_11804 [Histoplasma capsulatum G186AR]|uniref:Uncharacterized protein n=1 Tax=Ajellomyces capsulatus TaxID=5037 RepID=A0A8H7Z8D7_AJECA|nr:hypothetical protein I7I52_03042 [Histoplasma capsulatum]QSS70239.1 hypothetical protein I7I50_11804 [Histoplasma capsulatum G186AR]
MKCVSHPEGMANFRTPPFSPQEVHLQTFWCFGGFGFEGTLQGTLKLQAIILVGLDDLSRLR